MLFTNYIVMLKFKIILLNNIKWLELEKACFKNQDGIININM